MRTEGSLPTTNGKMRKLPSLEELCIQSAIDNLQHLGDVGQTDLALLQKILPHCTPEQLHRIESSSNGRDLSTVTDELWHKFYTRRFGSENVKLVLERMKKRRVCFKWHALYQAKLREQEEVQKKGVDRLKQLYVEANNLKQSRQIQLCSKVPPTRKRKRCDAEGGVANRFVNGKTSLLNKLRNEAIDAKMMQRSVPCKANFQQHRRSALPYPEKLPKPPQSMQTLQKASKHPTLEKDSGCKMSNSKNLLPKKPCTTAFKSTLGQIHKR